MVWAYATRRAARRAGAALALAAAAAAGPLHAAQDGAGAAAGSAGAAGAQCGGAAWPRWDAFKRDFVSADGRVIDVGSDDSRTVSEGQAYGLFFALVANDRRTFDTILAWTENNLAQGDLSARLPAWLWGRAPDGAWRVLDANAASDADLWIAYTLVEAGRLWHERSYTARGALLAKRVLDTETASVPGLGLTLLPGPTGFKLANGQWRVNPSYSPPQVIRGLAARLPDERRWAALMTSTGRVLLDTAPKGFAPDWALYRAGAGFGPDPQTHAESAYNAIRVYLWAGMLDRSDPLAAPLLARFAPFADHIAAHGAPPERVDTTTGVAAPNDGNGGFSAAAVPFLAARGQQALADAQAARVDALARQSPPGYYTSVLTLFGLGWRDGRYRFGADGTLDARWEGRPCAAR
ncbi:cellulose synthase complex periplasmic endoglucanase BcsZ [Burkholderia vietnamiensis]|uniref:cellulose synthase complex periplasmic endoglucanase BcsZ n=3 Tax=Burkholderia vietnamiensis TaxID=60552 RepID=UPI00075592EA|nr:cellulose synthase complex periplasmic endoglucanase BcsZ [Burkholderia vietnamiensis]KVF11483.1 endoglucanase [Burkholderia vietnamiensis]KVF27750.1 endoglucanase [Burkholderia vietnamiensis]KVF44737.1 endoglucanase [Burkholderia vietnamiensis]KVF62445.1 endoglucanase [Burkholderia vietnamiensis]MCA8287805.1 cellulase [Burkholderia vietnamiensis]